MSKSTYFIRTFNVVIKISLISIILGAFTFVIYFLHTLILKITFLNTVYPTLEFHLRNGYLYFAVLTIFSMFIWFVIIIVELLNRLLNDSLLNLIKSIWKTFRFRSSLKYRIPNNKSVAVNNTMSNYAEFNKSMNKLVVDLRKDKAIVRLKIPRGQQAQKLLIDMQQSIRDSLSYSNNSYIFFFFLRRKNWIYINGTKR